MSTNGLRSFRPRIHFTPRRGWSNDPNGLLYHQGQWHLFYQHNPDEPVWGPMYWGHATSRDLLHWQEEELVLAPDELGYIFSGSAVYDEHNTSGFGVDGKMPIVAVFTHHPPDGYEQQSIACSLDGGFHFEKYSGNPVIENPGIQDFRDPKVFWNPKKACWGMILAVRDCAWIYASADLKNWQRTGTFGKEQDRVGAVWECTDLFALSTPEGEKWVMLVSMMAPENKPGRANVQYFIGDFDGETFRQTEGIDETLWLDFGFDNYAGVTYNHYPKKIYQGWGVNMAYAGRVPTGEYAGLMTIPRELALAKTKAGYRLLSRPFGLEQLRADACPFASGGKLPGESFGLLVSGTAGTIILKNQTHRLVIAVTPEEILVDRSQAGARDFAGCFGSEDYSVARAKRLKPGDIDLELLFDVSYLEVFADGGLAAASLVVYPDQPYETILAEGDLEMKLYQLT